MPEKYVIIVAGGAGVRMGGVVPKQFLEVKGRPILMRTLEVFTAYDSTMPIVLVLPQNDIQLWMKLCERYQFKTYHQIVVGGSTRFQSVKNGLALIPEKGVVAIHDGVRPFVSSAIIADGFESASTYGNAVVSMPLKESIREVTDSAGASAARDRSRFRLIQTPQTFDVPLIKRAYEQPESSLFTDDASVVEASGEKIHLIEGSEQNIKITHRADLLLAEALILDKKSPI